MNAHQRRIKRRRIERAGMSLTLRHRAMLAEDAVFAAMRRGKWRTVLAQALSGVAVRS